MFKKTKIRQILALDYAGENNTNIALALSVSRKSIVEIKKRVKEINLTFEESSSMNDDQLYDLLFPEKFKRKSSKESIDFSYVHDELAKKGVTLHLLWEEYVDKCKKEGLNPYSYISFTTKYGKYTTNKSFTSHIEHKPGETIEVDWSGPTMIILDADSNKKLTAYLFVAALPYSQKIYVEATLSMDQDAWMNCNVNMLNYYGGVPLKIVCDNLKTGVIEHPKKGEVVINEEYLAFGEYYGVAIRPTGVRKPKEKPSAEGSVGKIATAVIARLRNETFYSLDGLNRAISKCVEDFNNKPFQKKEGCRNSRFNVEERHTLKPLPIHPYEVCKWSFKHIVMPNSHIVLLDNFYSVPHQYIGKTVDIKYNDRKIVVYYNNKEIAKHTVIFRENKNKYRTNPDHLPVNRQFVKWTYDLAIEKANNVGPNMLEIIKRLFENEKVKEQAFEAVVPILNLSKAYSNEILENACKKALDTNSVPHYKQIVACIKIKDTKAKEKEEAVNKNVRGASYYTKGNR